MVDYGPKFNICSLFGLGVCCLYREIARSVGLAQAKQGTLSRRAPDADCLLHPADKGENTNLTKNPNRTH